ncbi:MAG: aldolase/citrate lyase family protein [Actinomycetota bacterium]|nr:aldolase/citrate lyase family protein [Actinomycetota bacterium]
MTSTHLRSRWDQRTYARLAWVSIGDPQLVELAAGAGHFDAIVLDMQHGTIDQAVALQCLRAAGRWPVTVLARIASDDADLIGWLLDAGLDGVIVAMCQSAQMAQRIVAATRYAPEGTRSYGVFRAGTPGSDPLAAAREVIVIPMVESAAGLQHVDSIVAVDGVDGVLIGPGDLGLSLGHGVGQNRTELPMVAAFDAIREAAHRQGKRCGIFATTPDYARQTAAEGYDLVVPWYDSAAIKASLATSALD